jgi:hypothetical protein
MKEGLCRYCHKWFVIRTNHYKYHMQSVHGIDSITKRPFPRPFCLRYDDKQNILSWCTSCQEWIKLHSVIIEKREKITGIEMNRKCWYLHMMNIHGKTYRKKAKLSSIIN